MITVQGRRLNLLIQCPVVITYLPDRFVADEEDKHAVRMLRLRWADVQEAAHFKLLAEVPEVNDDEEDDDDDGDGLDQEHVVIFQKLSFHEATLCFPTDASLPVSSDVRHMDLDNRANLERVRSSIPSLLTCRPTTPN